VVNSYQTAEGEYQIQQSNVYFQFSFKWWQ